MIWCVHTAHTFDYIPKYGKQKILQCLNELKPMIMRIDAICFFYFLYDILKKKLYKYDSTERKIERENCMSSLISRATRVHCW